MENEEIIAKFLINTYNITDIVAILIEKYVVEINRYNEVETSITLKEKE